MPLFYKILYIHNRTNTEQVESVIGGYFCGMGQCVGFLHTDILYYNNEPHWHCTAVHERIRSTNTYTKD